MREVLGRAVTALPELQGLKLKREAKVRLQGQRQHFKQPLPRIEV